VVDKDHIACGNSKGKSIHINVDENWSQIGESAMKKINIPASTEHPIPSNL
jgi:hypothetical protein